MKSNSGRPKLILAFCLIIFAFQALIVRLSYAQWAATYGGSLGEIAFSIQQTADGGYIVAGSTGSFGAGSDDFLVLKLKANGDIEWKKTYGGADVDSAESIQQTSAGGYIVAGQTFSFGAGGADFWVLKLNPDGKLSTTCEKDAQVFEGFSNFIVAETDAEVADTDVDAVTSDAKVEDTNVSKNIVCLLLLPIPALTPLGAIAMALLMLLFGIKGYGMRY